MSLTDRFHNTLAGKEEDATAQVMAAQLVLDAADGSERNGLLALMYHEGIGVEVDLGKSFEFAEKAAFDGGDGLGYFLLGYMCDNAETPDQAGGGPRQKYDQYDAERFYQICSRINSRWRVHAVLWLGSYYMDMAKGGDPEMAVEYLESIANENADAAGMLSDYYWDLVMPEYIEDEEWRMQLFKWSSVAARLDPEEYSYRMGWIYADGLGCEQAYDTAIEYFGRVYEYGDWRGAKAIAKVFEEILEENPDLSDKKHCKRQIALWEKRASRLRKS